MIPGRGQLYWQARLSERYPTVEVRCCDVQLEADDAVMRAGIVRRLAATAIAEETTGTALEPPCRPELLQAAALAMAQVWGCKEPAYVLREGAGSSLWGA
ncbi:hypothetical protein [Streptomyces sp. NPDC000656]|uniref:hypothetical protein n=1 Tax=unclassified Streptomyces TaxID=2593676 RepID=UPI0036CF6241